MDDPSNKQIHGTISEEGFNGAPVSMKVGEENEIGSPGLKKKLLKEADGWDTLESDDEVQVRDSQLLRVVLRASSLRRFGRKFKVVRHDTSSVGYEFVESAESDIERVIFEFWLLIKHLKQQRSFSLCDGWNSEELSIEEYCEVDGDVDCTRVKKGDGTCMEVRASYLSRKVELI
ncbi:hypothetical protein Tco_0815516 [Tanacetum coccineum]